MASERISVIIPVYNGERFLAEAIRSVLDQTLPPDEVIVVDDGSTDGSAALASQYAGVLVLQQPNRGIGAALNLGISHACGDLFAFLDADDRWLPDKLDKQVSALTVDPALDMVFGHVRQFHQGATAEGEIGAIQPGLSRCSLLIRRSSFEKAGAFSEDANLHVFVDWYARAQEAGLRVQMLSDLLFERRIHDANLGRRTPDIQRQSYLQALRLTMRRRQAEGETV
jgi:glycosyltransferase involved in cell wall biosynthesis